MNADFQITAMARLMMVLVVKIKKKTVNDDNKIMVKINNNPITLWGFPRIMRKKFKYQHKTVKIANW